MRTILLGRTFKTDDSILKEKLSLFEGKKYLFKIVKFKFMKEENVKEYYAKVHSFESFGTLDGPGIRFILFLQGCSLKCKYCQNRDTWDIHGGEFKSLDEIFSKIIRYKSYICPNGGVTISGGEPLIQNEFLIQLFRKLEKEGIHTCIDTSGMFIINDKMKELINLTDLFLLDIKHIDSEKCVNLAGVPNKRELDFARYLSDNGKHMWIRLVLVPGFTDDENDLLKLKEFLSILKTVDRVDILPYHEMGRNKWKKLGVRYELDGVRAANAEDIARAKRILGIN